MLKASALLFPYLLSFPSPLWSFLLIPAPLSPPLSSLPLLPFLSLSLLLFPSLPSFLSCLPLFLSSPSHRSFLSKLIILKKNKEFLSTNKGPNSRKGVLGWQTRDWKHSEKKGETKKLVDSRSITTNIQQHRKYFNVPRYLLVPVKPENCLRPRCSNLYWWYLCCSSTPFPLSPSFSSPFPRSPSFSPPLSLVLLPSFPSSFSPFTHPSSPWFNSFSLANLILLIRGARQND